MRSATAAPRLARNIGTFRILGGARGMKMVTASFYVDRIMSESRQMLCISVPGWMAQVPPSAESPQKLGTLQAVVQGPPKARLNVLQRRAHVRMSNVSVGAVRVLVTVARLRAGNVWAVQVILPQGSLGVMAQTLLPTLLLLPTPPPQLPPLLRPLLPPQPQPLLPLLLPRSLQLRRQSQSQSHRQQTPPPMLRPPVLSALVHRIMVNVF